MCPDTETVTDTNTNTDPDVHVDIFLSFFLSSLPTKLVEYFLGRRKSESHRGSWAADELITTGFQGSAQSNKVVGILRSSAA